MNQKRCPNCYRRNAEDSTFCSNCGTAFAPTNAGAAVGHKSGNKQILVTVCAVAVALFVWEAAKILPGKIDAVLQARHGDEVETHETLLANAPRAVLTHDKDRLYGIMKAREAAINRETPMMINQMLKLNRVHYRPSTKTMSYNYEIQSDRLLNTRHQTVVDGLTQRYCTSSEFEEMRVNRVAAKFVYWDNGAKKFEHTMNGCY